MNKLIIATVAMAGLVCVLFVAYEIFYIPPSQFSYDPDVFEDYLRNEFREAPVSSIDQIRIYKCSRSRWWALERLEKRYGPPMVVTNLTDLKKVIDELHFPGERPSLNFSGIADKFHVIIKTKDGRLGYARVLALPQESSWHLKGDNTIYEIDEPSFLISLMDEQPSDAVPAP